MTDEERVWDIIKHHGGEMSSAGKHVMGLVIIESFAAIRAEVREKCAGIADDHAANAWKIGEHENQNLACSGGRNHGARAVASAIRAMGDK